MSVNRYELEDYGTNEDDGRYVTYEDYSALEARCAAQAEKLRMINELTGAVEQVNKLAQEATEKLIQERNALAAENAGLNQNTPDLQTMMSALDAFFADEEVPERAMLAAYDILRGAVKTPATDTFLAEVRASGIDQWIASRDGRWNGTTAEAERFAAQLRKGVQS